MLFVIVPLFCFGAELCRKISALIHVVHYELHFIGNNVFDNIVTNMFPSKMFFK